MEEQDNSLTVNSLNSSATQISAEKKLYLDQLLSKAIFITGSPFSIVEHPLWITFFNEIQPSYKLPTRKAISTTHLEVIYNEMVKAITEELKSTNDLHLQCDGWSNQRNEGIINFIIAKPEPFFVKSLNTLTNRHISQYLSQEIIKVMEIYGGDIFVTLIGGETPGIPGPGNFNKLPGKTRWGSYCTALESLKNSKVALQTLAVHEDATISEEIKSNILELNFWLMIEHCIKLLEPITRKIFKLEEISILNEQHKQDIINNVIKRTDNCMKPIHYAAYMLDPKSQGIELDEEHALDAMEYIHEVSQSLNIDVGLDLVNYRAKEGL
ncbi:hypothetical protein EVAR_87198_1 [Eumeta japonica]|uniref:Uncharacterized protein n=1 Tax=Eumeta variegata TaxID=151549 RepID=A0A4C1VXT7_EUMVA|nr:hypothetical protein EVAR_87198_1 [Eumeta japonica]